MGDVPEQVFIDAARADAERYCAVSGAAGIDVEETARLMARDPALRTIAASAYRAGQAATPDGPCSWALPDEPGPEVTTVRDREGRRWYRERRGWTHQNFAFPWIQILRDLGPLTDATPAADGQDGDGRGD
jgi:hypothetical protein